MRNRSCPRTKPTPAQKKLDRQAALEAASSLQQATSADEASRERKRRLTLVASSFKRDMGVTGDQVTKALKKSGVDETRVG
ncbi:hypothetical protein NDU88_003733 [Pleurodeles waltl]|uniref:Uncharacterized protein n=1 Tax=Pleurodeles waltl TaxID=8319 RepID=A0AAV7V2B9_PLEWA|nr:hypothetical protein NDU88_003733 [Pleurodeles waltl]